MEFKIQSVVTTRNSYDDSTCAAEVTIEVDSKQWSKLKKAGNLGFLYGTTVGNSIHKMFGGLIPTHCPSVSDKDRASKGIKYITLHYSIPAQNFKALGIDKYTDWSTLYHCDKTILRLVGA